MREIFNCGSKFSLSEQPVHDDAALQDEDSPVLHASDSGDESGSVLAATDSDMEGKDELLYASDEDSKAKRAYRKRRAEGFMLLGMPVCAWALRALLGYGEGTIQRIRAGDRVFSRAPTPKHPVFGFRLDGKTDRKWMGVVSFLWQVYQSAAELMPTDMRRSTKVGESPFPEKVQDPDHELRCVNKFMQTLATYSSDVECHLIGPGTFSGACRYLQSSSRTELYYEYIAASKAKGEEPGSYATFLRVANSILKPGLRAGHLKFRGICQHGQCNVCYELKTKIRKATTPDSRQEHYRSFSHHLLSQWLDRQQYWAFRTLSHQWFQNSLELGNRMLTHSVALNLLTCICDGMDQAKYKTPRVRERTSKLFKSLFRPVLHVSGTWIHGARFEFAVADQDMKKDSECQLEVINRCLSNLHESTGGHLPMGFVLQQDNCFREGKNRWIIAFMILLVSCNIFRYSVLNYLRTGHSGLEAGKLFCRFKQSSYGRSQICFDPRS